MAHGLSQGGFGLNEEDLKDVAGLEAEQHQVL